MGRRTRSPVPPRSGGPSGSDSLPAPRDDWALFLDIDGTLIEIAPTPAAVTVHPETVPLLQRLVAATGGALAVVSGRPLREIDQLLAPLELPAAGLHGLEQRDARGVVSRVDPDHGALLRIRDAFRELAAGARGALVEDKGASLALHYRAAPELEPEALGRAEALVADLGGRFHVLRGKMVIEIKPADSHKGDVVDAFMAEPPFAGRRPVFIGDDVTDEDGFDAVNRMGGESIRVGPAKKTAAKWRVASVATLRDWLSGLPAAMVRQRKKGEEP